MAGLFFCLASAEGAGLLFCLAAIQPHTSIYSGLYTVHTFYTAKTPKPFTGLYRGISVDLTHSSAHNTAATQTAYTPLAPRWRAYRQALHLHRYQIPPPRRTLYRAEQPPIIIRYIRGRRCIDLCQAIQHSADHASGSGSACLTCIRYKGQPGGWRSGTGQQSRRTLHPAGQSSGRGGAEPLAACRRFSFRPFGR